MFPNPRWRPPGWVLGLALFASALHVTPALRAKLQARAHPEWTFTGNLSPSPDYFQYRVWTRRSQVTGPLVDNRFTAEPTRPHLLVLFYWFEGQVARLSGLSPDATDTALGAAMAFALVWLIYAASSRFLQPPARTWAFLLIVFGGGLGAWLRLLRDFSFQHPRLSAISQLNYSGLWEAYRSHYVIKTLFDTHFLAIWLVTTAAVLALHGALRRPALTRTLWAAGVAGFATLVHVYEGILLIGVAACVAAALALKRVSIREWAPPCTAVAFAAGCCGLAQIALYHRSGLPLPDWKGPPVFFSNVVLAYPLAWIGILLGFAAWWRNADRDGCLLVGWAAACALITLSAPYYSFPGRGPLTWSIPLYLIAAAIWMERKGRLTLAAMAAMIVIAGATPYGELRARWHTGDFSTTMPSRFIGPEHRQLLDTLLSRAGPEDVLLADSLDYYWLAPDFPGRTWHGHYFNTPGFEAKRAAVAHFFGASSDEERARFLAGSGARFLFVAADRRPVEFERLPQLNAVSRNRLGTLFTVERGVTGTR